MMSDYEHLKCECGGTIGNVNRDTFKCLLCGKEFRIALLQYDWLAINDKTGWMFPMKKKKSQLKEEEAVIRHV